MDRNARQFIDSAWEKSILPVLADYIRIPNKSPMFDPEWAAHGYMDQAVDLLCEWARANLAPDMTLEVVRLPGRTPVIFIEAPADGQDRGTVLLYGHLDKQPEMTGWRDGLAPWEPVFEDGKLYGRGGADDGYSLFASLIALAALREQGRARSRAVVLIEACEESGSYDLPFYIDHLRERIGSPDLVVCLDSGCGNYEQLWCTTSLRGMVAGVLRVDVLKEGVHSGDAGGIVPTSFRVLRALLERLERASDGVIDDAFQAPVPAQRRSQAEAAAKVLGEPLYRRFPFVDGVRPVTEDPAEMVLNRTWRAALDVTGADGLPALSDAGNVARPGTAVKLSLRLPPTVSGAQAGERLVALLERDPPCGAKVSFSAEAVSDGWNAPELTPWLESALERASMDWFGKPLQFMGEGGTIPFMAMLGEKFPRSQFLVTGVLGPKSNAHGPNEFLHIATAKSVTGCVADVLAAHYDR